MARKGFTLFIILLIQCVTVRADYYDADRAYETGDYAYAFNEYKRLAERGDARAQLRVGWMYYYGEGVGQDNALALVWYRKAAEQGDVTSMFNLAYGYEHGEGVRRDLDESRRWYGRVAGQRDAMERLDFQWLTKTFLTLNAAQARAAAEWAERKRLRSAKAAEGARIAAEVPPGTAPAPVETPPAPDPRKGHGGDALSPAAHTEVKMFRDPRLERIRRAAEAGDEHAQVTLGWIYSSGKGVPVDKAKAARWYRLAAEKGNLKAQVALGWMYYDGEGCGRNLEESALWYNKAAARGDTTARQMLKKIARLLRKT